MRLMMSESSTILAPATTVRAFAIRTGVTLIPFRRPPLLRFRAIEYRLRRGAAARTRRVRRLVLRPAARTRRLPPPRFTMPQALLRLMPRELASFIARLA